MLEVQGLEAEIDGKAVLQGLDLKIQEGEVHAIMGPNGSGKSTLAKVLAGHPSYEVTGGSVSFEVNFEKKNLLEISPWERAREGLFLAYQYPIEIPGVSNRSFLRESYNAICQHQGVAELSDKEFEARLIEKSKLIEFNPDFLDRSVNEGFSGGEKKRNEILQMAVLSPRLAVLDETDSGLDIDSLKIVAKGVNQLRSQSRSILMITHYQRLLDYIQPDYVHVLSGGKIVKSGGPELAHELEKRGYDWLH